ncbi:flagellar assembly peptidoglycan hydrolase FlgJ [Billgrantia gudaonensis]|uniref:Peptidoglycan hydrolase FlgJ n=1 Tax=Billgrantia gudaonensis TaxID=376427 RepID=A0A1G8T2V5_9GAMM|nr:flagellar assembly peptidoglycan hydrolase FlgJ [Halomonas gudaonensis]SDJ35814.1 flagellar protein FlgJ [Halomonas gudaonensis]
MSIQNTSGQFALDMQGLQRLKHTAKQDAGAGLQEAAKQFEAMFLQMMVKSMRDAVPSSDLTSSKQTEFYQSMLDQQWAQTMSERGVGLADHLVEQLQSRGLVPPSHAEGDRADIDALVAGIPRGTPRVLENAIQPDSSTPEAKGDASSSAVDDSPSHFLDALDAQRGGFMNAIQTESTVAASAPSATSASTAEPDDHRRRFTERLVEPAQVASRRTGVPAELILAQAALETGWGRHEIPTASGGNSHNLFGIKAGSSWNGQTTEITTHEYVDGRRTRVTDAFRVYDSFEEAFTDYAGLIGDNPRYASVTQAGSPEQAARALQSSGYATDPAYADKLVAIMGQLRDAAGTALADAGTGNGNDLSLAQSLYRGTP